MELLLGSIYKSLHLILIFYHFLKINHIKNAPDNLPEAPFRL